MTNKRPLSKLSKTASLPLYQQIKENIKHGISSRDWAVHGKLPSENDLVKQLKVSRMTVNRALRELAQEGVLYRVHGVGTFVSPSAPRHASLIQLQDIAEEIRKQGRQYSCRILQQRQLKATSDMRLRMALTGEQRVYHLKMLHSQDNTPLQLENRFVNPALVPDFLSQDFTEQTSTRYLTTLFKPDEMEHIVKATLVDKTTARILHIEPTEPCLQLTRRTWKNDRIVTLVTMTYPGSRYDLGARYSTDDFPLKSF